MTAQSILFVRELPLRAMPQLSTHQLAKAASAAGHRVLWASRPITPFNFHYSDKRNLQSRNRAEPNPAGIEEIVTISPWSRKRYLPARNLINRTTYTICAGQIRRQLQATGIEQLDTLWMSDIIALPLIERLSYNRLVFQVTDDYRAFDNFAADLATRLGPILRNSDCVFFTNDALRTEYRSVFQLQSDRCFHLTHAVSSKSSRAPRISVPALAQMPFAFIGTINDDIDWAWLGAFGAAIAPSRIAMYGPATKSAETRMKAAPWCDYLGAVDVESRTDVLRQHKFGLIPFAPTVKKAFSEPMKLFDYAEAGLVMLSRIHVPPQFMNAMPNGLFLTPNPDAAVQVFKSATPELLQRHRRDCEAFCKKNTWDCRWAQAEAFMAIREREVQRCA
ncbi:MAG: hypothetical protein AAFR21_13690 [Pseudomonadota bacterium]